jgi:hypothetical protein
LQHFVPHPEEQEFYIDLVRVIGNGVVLSAVEHPEILDRRQAALLHRGSHPASRAVA